MIERLYLISLTVSCSILWLFITYQKHQRDYHWVFIAISTSFILAFDQISQKFSTPIHFIHFDMSINLLLISLGIITVIYLHRVEKLNGIYLPE